MWSSITSSRDQQNADIVELTARPPGIPIIALAIPGQPIPIIREIPILFPVVWPDVSPVIIPPNVDTRSIFGSVSGPDMGIESISGGKYLKINRMRVSRIIELRVNWPVRVAKAGTWNGQRCPVMDAAIEYLAKAQPIAVAMAVAVPLKMSGVFPVSLTPTKQWPIAGSCKPCPAGRGGLDYQRLRSKLETALRLPDECYIAMAKQCRLIKCAFEGPQ